MRKSIENQQISPIIAEALNNHQEVILRVSGHSMNPFFFHQETLVTIKQQDVYHKYDIVLAIRDNQHLILHRLIQINEAFIRLRGDGQTTCEVFRTDQILGKVVSFEQKGRVVQTSSKRFRFWSRVWQFLILIRRPLLKVMRRKT